MIEVVCVDYPVSHGRRLAKYDLTIRKVPSLSVPSDVITDKTKAAGRVIKVDLDAGPLTEHYLN